MVSKIIYNQEVVNKKDFKLSIENRGFLYGDGIFESIRIINGKPFNLEAHISRIFSAALFLHLTLSINKDNLKDDVLRLIHLNKIKYGAYMRITFFREEGGKYTPRNNKASYIITISLLDKNLFQLNKTGLHLGLYNTELKSINKLSSYKTINSLPYILCSLASLKNNLDDSIMFNINKCIIETSNSNLFIVNNDIISTPHIDSGCVDGTMRRYILNLRMNYKWIEKAIKLTDILEADEVFLSNAISGIRWVKKIEDTEFKQNRITKSLIKDINSLV